jgi:hypothetical protein
VEKAVKGLRSAIALTVVLAAVGGYAYYLSKKSDAPDSASKQEKVFASLQSDKIEELRISTADGEQASLKKDNGAWQMTAPVATKADESEVNGITSALGSVEITRVVDENPSSLTDYGLSNPKVVVDFKAAGDKDFRKLLIGDKSATGGDLFAKRNDEKKVFLIPAYQETTFSKKPFDLRDKVVMKLDRDKVDGVTVTAGGKTLAFTKNGSDWQIKKPIDTKADFGTVEGLVGKLQTVQMKSMVGDEPSAADLKKYGLDKPEATIDLNAGSAKATLIVGGKADDNTVYARDASKAAVVTIEKSLVDDLKKGADDYRVKDLFQFRAYNAMHVEITRGDQKIVFDKVKAASDKDKDKWHRASPNPADVDLDKVDALLAKIANMRASAFVDSTAKTGLDKPAMTVYVKFDAAGTKEERVTFGKAGEDVFASRPGEPGAMKTDTTDFNEANKSLDELSKAG